MFDFPVISIDFHCYFVGNVHFSQKMPYLHSVAVNAAFPIQNVLFPTCSLKLKLTLFFSARSGSVTPFMKYVNHLFLCSLRAICGACKINGGESQLFGEGVCEPLGHKGLEHSVDVGGPL